jgi:hypothetical protein
MLSATQREERERERLKAKKGISWCLERIPTTTNVLSSLLTVVPLQYVLTHTWSLEV